MPLSLQLYRILIGHYMMTGGNSAIRQTAYTVAGGYNASKDMIDDVDLSFRITRYGKITYVSKLCILTEGDIIRHGFLKEFWRYFEYFPAYSYIQTKV